MAGFDPVGSTPVGATGTTAISGTYLNPATAGNVTFSGSAPTTLGLTPAYVSQATVETLLTATSDAYVSQATVETLLTATSSAYVSQIVVEVLMGVTTQNPYRNYQFVNT